MATKVKYPRLLLIRSGTEFTQKKCVTKSTYERAKYCYTCGKEAVEYYYKTKGEGASKAVQGYRSVLRLEVDADNSVDYFAIERANGFTHLAEGAYKALMLPRAHYPNNQEIYVTGNIFIHAADYPVWLDGCIGPGTSVTDDGVGESAKALAEIIDGLGGWKKDRIVRVEVRGYGTRPG